MTLYHYSSEHSRDHNLRNNVQPLQLKSIRLSRSFTLCPQSIFRALFTCWRSRQFTHYLPPLISSVFPYSRLTARTPNRINCYRPSPDGSEVTATASPRLGVGSHARSPRTEQISELIMIASGRCRFRGLGTDDVAMCCLSACGREYVLCLLNWRAIFHLLASGNCFINCWCDTAVKIHFICWIAQ